MFGINKKAQAKVSIQLYLNLKQIFVTEKKTGYALKKSKIYYDNRIIEGDSLYFDNNRSFASANNNIKVTDE